MYNVPPLAAHITPSADSTFNKGVCEHTRRQVEPKTDQSATIAFILMYRVPHNSRRAFQIIVHSIGASLVTEMRPTTLVPTTFHCNVLHDQRDCTQPGMI
jgi:hypothetical protein